MVDDRPFVSESDRTGSGARILIVDSFSSANRGDAAILTVMMESLSSVLGDVEFKVHSSYPDLTSEIHNVDATYTLFETHASVGSYRKLHGAFNNVVSDGLVSTLVQSLWWRLLSVYVVVLFIVKIIVVFSFALIPRFILNRDLLLASLGWRSLADYAWADVVLAPGGTNYNDNYWVTLPGRLFNLLYGTIIGKPVGISGHSFGPFRRRAYRMLARFVFNRLDLLCCRHAHDVAVLTDLGVHNPRIEVTADNAWLQRSSSPDRARDIFSQEGVHWDNKDLHVSLSAIRTTLYRGDNVEEAHQRYIKCMAKLVDYLVLNWRAKVVFVSTCTNIGNTDADDRLVADEIKQLVTNRDSLSILEGQYTAADLKAIYAVMDLHVGTRMHSNILAASSGTPFVAIACETKTFDMVDEFQLGDCVVDINDINVSELLNVVSIALQERSQLREKILRRLPHLEYRASLNARYVVDLLPRWDGFHPEDSSCAAHSVAANHFLQEKDKV